MDAKRRNGGANIIDWLAFMEKQLPINYYYQMPIAHPTMEHYTRKQKQMKLNGGLAFDWPNDCFVCFRHRILRTSAVSEGSRGHNELCPFKEKPEDPDIIRWMEAQNPLPKHFEKGDKRKGMSHQAKIDDFFVKRICRDKAE